MDEDATAFKEKFSFKKKEVEIVEVEIISIDDYENYCSEESEDDVIQSSQPRVQPTESSDALSSSSEFSPTKEKENTIKDTFKNVGETKSAWKGLVGLMQKNQKEALKNIKNKPQKRGLTAVFDAAKNKQKKSKLDIVSSTSNWTSTKQSMDTLSSSPQKQTKVADIFLKPKERLAAATNSANQKSLEHLKLCGGENFLKAVSLPTLAKPEEIKEDPKYFDGNVVKLNTETFPNNTAATAVTKTKVCPFYKKLPGTNFSVDAFNFGVIPGIEVYFLSHYHSDHYIGLTKKFSKTLVCSIPTGNLVTMKIGVNENCIRKLQLNKPYIIEGSEIVLVDANHCPGSVMFIMRLKNGTTYFHTGDFRYTSDMLDNTYISGAIGGTDCLYLDTTYCDPKYDFPKQTDSIGYLVGAVKKHVERQPKTLIICGSYLIGKERVYFSLAEALSTKVYGATDKCRIIRALENPLFTHYLSDRENLANIHVMNMQCINPKFLSEYLSTRSNLYTNVIGIKPSGWQFSSSGSGGSIKNYYGNTVTIIGVPYSEHSSFSELKEFVTAIKPLKIQPTVNVGSAKKRTEMTDHFAKWLKK